ncbi:hypothetical protein B4N89_31150 [Embleya scabrispora]|uniref:Secreted protein n=1 Tax=Embleya scabrispora TaxID=159449 RepID=A0A1T3NPK3_9ACTN|nr:hypothetical protein [Embleya scabrispora]OPC78635.1 hypothetical protein B4N89_31150 [Embleya scabrispora]
MRNARIVAAATGLSLLMGAGAAVAVTEIGTASATPRTITAPPEAVSAADAATRMIDQLGAVGAVTKAVGDLASAATAAPPDAAKVKEATSSLEDVAKALLGKLPTAPAALPVRGGSSAAPLSPADAVTALLKDGQDLRKAVEAPVAAAPTTADPDVPTALANIAKDLLGLVTSVTTALGGGALPA